VFYLKSAPDITWPGNYVLDPRMAARLKQEESDTTALACVSPAFHGPLESPSIREMTSNLILVPIEENPATGEASRK
jgi:hypothetical protein